ncbi:MAG: hypothetical protein ACXWVD_15705, partial [Telluria sp.]
MDQAFTYQEMEIDERASVGSDGGDSNGLHSTELKRFRISKRESQEKFWGRFGVTQSSGSR